MNMSRYANIVHSRSCGKKKLGVGLSLHSWKWGHCCCCWRCCCQHWLIIVTVIVSSVGLIVTVVIGIDDGGVIIVMANEATSNTPAQQR